MFLSNADCKCYTSTTTIASASALPSITNKYPRGVQALTRRYTKKSAKMGISMEWIDRKVLEDVEIVRKEYLLTGKGEPSDEFVRWFGQDVLMRNGLALLIRADSSLNNEVLSLDTPLPSSPSQAPAPIPNKPTTQTTEVKTVGTTEAKTAQEPPNPTEPSDKECLEAPQTSSKYISLNALGYPEPESPKCLEITQEEDSPDSSPPTIMKRIKSALKIEPNQK
ncbi:hypothetical protein NHQ30_006197 [Ciborinia camelliae]|nr:hypothetical protein NHQ30_006197 [Ciborinia camelliae]